MICKSLVGRKGVQHFPTVVVETDTGKIEDDPLRTRMELRFKHLFPLSLSLYVYICIYIYVLGCITISSD